MAEAPATDAFEQHRGKLMSLAYQMTGSVQEAEDILQEAWLRWSAVDTAKLASAGAWLHRVVSRIALDRLRSAHSRREVYPGPWLPEPVIEGGPSSDLELAQDCELAMLWALERLRAEERAVFLLHSVFDFSFREIAAMLDRSEATCRQIGRRARLRVQATKPRFDTTQEQVQAALSAFYDAITHGDRERVLQLLSEDVVAISDGGGVVNAARIPLVGKERVAQVHLHLAAKHGALMTVRQGRANGQPALFMDEQGMSSVFTVRLNNEGKICWIYNLRNPDKLIQMHSMNQH